jgi:hypothetical protein
MPGIEDVTGRPPALAEDTAAPAGWNAASEAPRGAFLVAGIATALLLVGWLAFYFLLFMPRGSIG